MGDRVVGVIGATSLVGDHLLPLLVQSGADVVAFSRRAGRRDVHGVEWRMSGDPLAEVHERPISDWIMVAPVWVLPEHFRLLAAYGARRIVVLSSTSLFVKGDSSDAGEKRVAAQLAAGESALQAWADPRGVEWLVLRPTLIYGDGRDQNIAAAARFIRRFGFFPLVGRARGLRQPVHAADVAQACVLALEKRHLKRCSYNISGKDTLAYRDMIAAVFAAMGREPRLLSVPQWLVRLAIIVLRRFPGFGHVTAAMAERMNRDLVFDHASAHEDFGYAPRPFRLASGDLPP